MDKFSHFIDTYLYHILMSKWLKIYFILVCKILTNGIMGLKLSKILYLTQLPFLAMKIEESTIFLLILFNRKGAALDHAGEQ